MSSNIYTGICPKCQSQFTKEIKHGYIPKFCSRSCANRRGPRSEETKAKQRKWSIENPRGFALQDHETLRINGCKSAIARGQTLKYLIEKVCPYCDSKFKVYSNNPKKFCSPECVNNSRNKWGRCLSIPYYSKYAGDVKLQSNWEVQIAQYLDIHNINWIRPRHIPWIDQTGKTRKYFPDFYLSNYDLYIDPKNPQVQESDKEKLTEVSKIINLKFGNVTELLKIIENLTQPLHPC